MSSAQQLVALDGPPERATASSSRPRLHAAQRDCRGSHAGAADPVGRGLGGADPPGAGPRHPGRRDPCGAADRCGPAVGTAQPLPEPARRAGLPRRAIASRVCLVGLLAVAPLLLVPRWGAMAAMLIAIWVGGSVVTIRAGDWCTPRCWSSARSRWVSGLEALCRAGRAGGDHAADVRGRGANVGAATPDGAGTMRRALLAALIGGLIGLLLVLRSDARLGRARAASRDRAASLDDRQLLGRLLPVELLRRDPPGHAGRVARRRQPRRLLGSGDVDLRGRDRCAWCWPQSRCRRW